MKALPGVFSVTGYFTQDFNRSPSESLSIGYTLEEKTISALPLETADISMWKQLFVAVILSSFSVQVSTAIGLEMISGALGDGNTTETYGDCMGPIGNQPDMCAEPNDFSWEISAVEALFEEHGEVAILGIFATLSVLRAFMNCVCFEKKLRV